VAEQVAPVDLVSRGADNAHDRALQP
jgi:hypothetical protein